MSVDPVNTPRRRRGLRLRWLILAAVPAAAIVCFWASDQARRRQAALRLADRLGGDVILDRDHIPTDPSKSALPPRNTKLVGPSAIVGVEGHPRAPRSEGLEALLGPGLAHKVTVLNLDARRVADDDLAAFAGLRDIEYLYLNATPITDNALAHLASLTGLRRLELRETSIGDAGMAHLAGLGGLRELYLTETRVGDAGLAWVASMTGLRELRLSRTSVRDDGLRHVAALKGLRVLRLNHTRVGDAGLASIGGLGELQELDLSGTAITDAGLARLALLKNLRLLHLEETAVSDEAVSALSKAQPALRIFRGRTPTPRDFRRPGDSLKNRC